MNIFVGPDSLEIAAAIRPEQERQIEALLARLERSIASAFGAFLARTTSAQAVDALVSMIEEGRIEEALRFVEFQLRPVGVVIAEAVRSAAMFEFGVMAPKAERARRAEEKTGGGGGGRRLPPSIMEALTPLPPASVTISFDTTNARAVEAMRVAKDDFLTMFSAGQREVIRTELMQGLGVGQNPRQTARAVRDVIGLSPRQQQAMQRYRLLLEQGSSEALQYAHRDRRSDSKVKKAVKGGKPLTKPEIDRLVDAYRKRAIAYRAEMLALDESAKALAAGREEGLRQVVEQSGIDPQTVTREWRSMRDRRVRDTHIALDGQKAPLDGVFISPSGARLRYPKDPRAPLSETAGCRCYTVSKIK